MTEIPVSVSVSLLDRLTGPIKSALKPVERFSEGISKTQRKLDELGQARASVEQFRKIKASVAKTGTEMASAQGVVCIYGLPNFSTV